MSVRQWPHREPEGTKSCRIQGESVLAYSLNSPCLNERPELASERPEPANERPEVANESSKSILEKTGPARQSLKD